MDVVPWDQPLRGLVLVTGHRSCLVFSQLLCLQYLRRGEPVLLIDASNAFDPLILSDAARAEGLAPQTLLRAMHLSRAYTCYQLETLVTERLDPTVAVLHPRAVLCLGLLDLLEDDDVPPSVALRIFRRLLPAFRRLSARLPVLLACPEPPPPHDAPGLRAPRFHAHLQRWAQWHFTTHPGPEGTWITRTRPVPGRWIWSPPYPDTPHDTTLRPAGRRARSDVKYPD
jgi:hypothetical protein